MNEIVRGSIAILENLLPKMLIGMLAGSFLISTPIFKTLAKSSAKILKIKSGIVVVSFLANKTLSLSILSQMHKKGIIDDREVFIASIAGLFPTALRSAILTLMPVAISTLGFKIGATYVALELFSKFIIMCVAIWFGRRVVNESVSFDLNYSLLESVVLALKTFIRVSAIIVPTIFATQLLINSATVDEKYVIVFAGAGSTLAGFGVVGSLLSIGRIDEKSALMSLFVALAIHRIVESIRFSSPLNISFFGHKLGIKLSVLTLLANEASCILSITLLYATSLFGLIDP